MQQLKFDGELEIAIGKSRKETSWKNTTTTWSALVEKLSQTHRTVETVAEYKAATVARQAELKDVGGFVAGNIHGGRRKADSVTSRSALTLDLDFAKPGFWNNFSVLYDCAALVYSTHKHTAKSPRLRLVIPLNRPVYTDEYTAIARKVASSLGINDFDDTTFEPSRLMYWPSTSSDGEYEFHYTDGEWLDADEVLAQQLLVLAVKRVTGVAVLKILPFQQLPQQAVDLILIAALVVCRAVLLPLLQGVGRIGHLLTGAVADVCHGLFHIGAAVQPLGAVSGLRSGLCLRLHLRLQQFLLLFGCHIILLSYNPCSLLRRVSDIFSVSRLVSTYCSCSCIWYR